MRSMRPDKEINCISIRIPRRDGKTMPALVLLPKNRRKNAPGIYPSDMHAFDMMAPDEPLSKQAAERFNQQFAYAVKHYFALNEFGTRAFQI